MFTTAKLTAMKRRISLPPIVWIGLAIVLGSWQPSALAETDCNAVTEIPKAQCETLIAIYDSTAGDNWTNNTGWKQTNTLCSWYGVTCENSALVNLLLIENNLTGSLPDLSALSDLQWISFHNNHLTGSIPNLSSNLQYLYLSDNELTGSIPALTNLAKLQILVLDNNQLTGVIPDLSGVPGLIQLSVADNQLSGPIPDLSVLPTLVMLNLANNSQLCRDHNADYAGQTGVNEFPVCGNPNITLTSPTDSATSIPISGQVFDWEATIGTYYRIVISTQADFAGFTEDGGSSSCDATCITASMNTTLYTASNLAENTTYYWKVRADVDSINWSEVRSFTTGAAPKTGCNGDTQLPENLCNGLVAYYPLDSNPNDASGNGNDGTEYNVNYGTGVVGQAAKLDTTGYIRKENFNFTAEDITVALWAYADKTPDNTWGRALFALHSGGYGTGQGDKGVKMGLIPSGEIHPTLITEDGQTGIGRPIGSMEPKKWHHLAFVRHSGGLQKLYVDGVRVSAVVEKSILDAQLVLQNGLLEIGAPSYYEGGWEHVNRNQKWEGLLDEMYVYNRELTDTEVQSLYNAGGLATPPQTGCNGDTQLPDDLCNGLVAYYPLDSNPNDASGNGNDGTEYNVNYGTGVVGNALDLDGTGYIRKENFNFTTGDFSVAIWVKNLATDSTTRFLYAIHSGGDGKGQGDKTIDAHYYQNRAIRAILTTEDGQGAGSDTNQVANPGTILDEQNTWYHLVFTRQNGLLKLYKDGVRVSAVEERNVLPQFSVENGLLEIGAPNYYQGGWITNGYETAKWLGMLDEMYLYNRGLSDAEIGRLYSQNQAVQSPTPISCANVTNAEIPANLQTGLFAYYSLDGHACDVSGNGNNNAVEYNTDFASGVVGQALQLDGTGYIQHRDFDFTAEDLTVALWAKASSKAERYLFAIHSGGTGTGAGDQTVNLHTRGSGNAIRVFLTTKDGQTSDEQIVMPVGGSIEPDNWYHIALVRQAGGSQKLYIDGVPVKAANEQNVLSQFSVENGFLEIGAPNYYKGGWNSGRENAKWQGMLDDVYLYTRVLSDAEIQSLYNAASPVSQSMLEDAEDGGTGGWQTFEERAGGAAFENVFDSEINSRVIEFTGDSRSGYSLTKPDGSAFSNTTDFIAQWRMKTAPNTELGRHTFTWGVTTSGSVITITYHTGGIRDCRRWGTRNRNQYVSCGLDGSRIRDGKWHTITRDLEADLKAADSSLELQEVRGVSTRTAGRVDDIQLLNRDAVNFYTISGTITDENGQGMSGTPIMGATCQQSDSQGYFECTVPEGWVGGLTISTQSDDRFFAPVTRSYSEVSENITAQNFTAKPIRDGLLGHWTFDDCDAKDSSGNDIHGVIYGAPKCVDGIQSKGLSFNGIDESITVDGHINFAGQNITATAWAYIEEATKGSVVFKYDWLHGNGINYSMGTGGTGKFANTIGMRTESAKDDEDIGKSYPRSENEQGWVHLAMVLTPESQKLYANGELKEEVITLPEGFEAYTGARPLEIAGVRHSEHVFFNSVMDDVRIYNRALTDAEILALATIEFDCNNVTEIPTAQCETLLALYDNTGGDNWTNNDGWKKGNTPCNWYNVACKDGHVTDIALENNNLVGTIPDLSALSELETLSIGSNLGINSNFPDISQLPKLYHFSAGQTNLSGTLPANIVNATNLQQFGVSETKLSGELPKFSQLPNLTHLNLGSSQFTGEIPPLPNGLTLLNLAGNTLCRNSSIDYTEYSEAEAFPICGEQPPEPVIAEPIVEGNSVTLDASGSSDPDPNGEITNHRWVTSDGRIVTGANQTITFPNDGEHTITLIVTDNTGKTTELEQVVTIGDPIIPKVEEEEKTGPFKLTVNKRGTGKGSIQSTVPDTNIVCAADCNQASSEYAKDTEVTIMATPATGSIFTNWTGCGNGTDSTTTVTMSKRRYCTANFELDQTQAVLHRVRVVKIGDGKGLITVKQDRDTITRCSTATCEPKFFAPGTELTFIAKARNDAIFVGWGEDCSGTELKLPIIINAATKCTAEFTLPPPLPTQHRLTVTTIMETTAQGDVTGSGIECGDDCVENILAGKKARLTANPMPHSHFKEWANDCSGTRTSAAVIMDSAKTCTAIFGSDSDRNAEKLVEEFNDEAELIGGGEKFTDVYPPIDNTECLLEAYRLTENVMIKVEEHLFLTGSWPHQFHGQEWYKPMPADICTKSIKIISGGTDVKLAEGPVFVEGDYIKVEVELLTSANIKEILPILIYYGDKPEAEDANLRRRRARRYCCWRPRRRRW